MTRGDGTSAASGAGQAVQPQDVILRDAGANPGAVAEVVRSMTGLEPAAVQELLAKTPCAVRSRISPALAEALRAKLVAAGGRVEVRAHVPPPALFDVFLRGHGLGKINVIRAVKMLLGLDLREAIELVDEAPCLLKRKVDREEAETFRHELTEVGAELEIREHDPSTPERPPRALARVEAIAAAGEALAAAEGPGPFAVILQQCGPNKISVIKAIREAVPEVGLKEAKDLAESTGRAVRRGLSASEATALQRALAGLGAVVEVRAEDAPAPVPAAGSRVRVERLDVVLRECGPRKIAVIKVIREWTALGLKEAKDMSETPGSTVKAGVERGDAEKLERQLVEAGAVVELRVSAEEAVEPEAAEPEAVGATVDVFLRDHGPNKIVVIKEVRALTGLGLKDTKDLVEAAPTLIKTDVDGETARKLQQMLAAFGAVIELR